ncbi:MAG: uncharacterized protein KVP18_004794 [Porospora cf. gigantea A]|uniref:uncharacterized protein n=1 Tax=Porospora cf. gigantea A TaxID=2853593 RepID=UPI003559724B|nr:MAG: hypothetical protein KVP18_004794 [Porospora cf. gigantea A]
MVAQKVFFTDFPVFTLVASAGDLYVSGGGGGAEYGIPNVLERYSMAYSDFVVGRRRQLVRGRALTSMGMTLTESLPEGIFDGLQTLRWQGECLIGGVGRFMRVIATSPRMHEILSWPVTQCKAQVDVVALHETSLTIGIVLSDGSVSMWKLPTSPNLPPMELMSDALAFGKSGATDAVFVGNSLLCVGRNGALRVYGAAGFQFETTLTVKGQQVIPKCTK